MKKEIIITDIYEAAVEKERLSKEITKDKWRILDYETAKYSGKLVCASAKCSPRTLSLKLGAHGRFHIYLGMMQLRGAPTVTSLHLSDTEELSHVSAITRYSWTPLESMVEYFWKTADLTDKDLIIEKPKDYLEKNSSLAWVKLVPADEEPKKLSSIAYHLDSDYFADDEYSSVKACTGRIADLSDGGVKLILQEGFATSPGDKYTADETLFPRAAKYEWFHKNKSEIESALIDKAHSIGAEIYATYRLQAGEFCPPNDHSGINILFPDSYKDLNEYRCISRDGRTLGMCSYAYPAVRARVIENLMSFMERDYDGLALVFNRGTFVAFEKPICDAVMKQYGVDARRLPMSDERYRSVACSFVSEFLRELREALDAKFTKRKKINAIVFFTPEDSKSFGFDVETWVNEGLVDGISQGLMRVFENLDGCFSDDGLVDLKKYKMALLERPTVKREFRATPENLDLIVSGAEKFMRICLGKAEFYATLLWEAQTEEETIAIYERLNAIGAKSFISWNANHKAKVLSRINAEKFYVAGSREEYNAKKTSYIRTLSIGGTDISQFNPNWKG